MADIGHELTDELLEELEKRVKEEYGKALADAEKKLADWLKKFTREDEEKKKLLASGQITEKEYKDWRFRHIMMGKEWEKMRDTIAEDFHNANQIALDIARGEMADVYALNMNYGTYDIEHGGEIDTGFQLYNHDAAELLMREEHVQLMPGPSTRKAAEIAANKDLQWNQRHIQSAVLQGILQGESPYDVARRLQSVAQMNYNNAVRYARTMTTAAQNAGRYEAFRRADRLGVDLTIVWQATLDQRTRHDHRLMHGQRTTVDKPFHTPDGFTIMWPADCTSGVSTAPQGEIWNCRCTLLSWVKGFEPGTVTHSPKMGDMSFEEWQQAKPMSKEEQDAWIKAGKPSLDEWEKARKPFTSTKNNGIIASPEINSRGAAGRPSAVIGGAELNERQKRILSELISDGDTITVKKSEVNMRDLSALSASEGVEFALLTRRSERMVIRGTERKVQAIDERAAEEYRNAGWRWSGHTHVVGGLIPSDGDMKILHVFQQTKSTLFDAAGHYIVIEGRDSDA